MNGPDCVHNAAFNPLKKSIHPRNVGVYEGCFSAYLNKTFKFVSKMPGQDRI